MKSDYQKFLEELEQKDEENTATSFSERVGYLKSPVFNIIDNYPLWSQIPVSGTALFAIQPISERSFEKIYGIARHEIPDFIRFAKDTKKIAFTLAAYPTIYKSFDYLEPILREFQPPVFRDYLGENADWGEKLSECWNEIRMIARSSRSWNTFFLLNPDMEAYWASRFCGLRYFGFDEIADSLSDSMLGEDHEFSSEYLHSVNNFILLPLMKPIGINVSYSLDQIQRAKNWKIPILPDQKTISFPEVGSYLMDKCTYYPESLDACKDLIARYNDEDLYKVFSALNSAVIERQDVCSLNKAKEMGQILDNVWSDKKIRQDTKMYSWGISIACGTMGYSLGGLVPGFLATFGMKGLEKSNYIETFSELIAKKVASPSLATVYDFQKKYRLN